MLSRAALGALARARAGAKAAPWAAAPSVSVRGKAAAAAGDDDVVASTFSAQQKQFRAFLDGAQKIKFPLGAKDDAAIKAYAADLGALKKKVGVAPRGRAPRPPARSALLSPRRRPTLGGSSSSATRR